MMSDQETATGPEPDEDPLWWDDGVPIFPSDLGVQRPLTDEIMDVWADYDDFDSLDYVGFVIESEAKEIRDAEWDEAETELADIAICALRMLAENTDDPNAVVRKRLRDRMAGHQDGIITTYKEQFEAQKTDE